MITMTEKRFFEWHEDDVSVTLRNSSGSYGGGSEVLVVEAEGVDIYNATVTGGTTSTMRNSRADNDHVPCVIVRTKK